MPKDVTSALDDGVGTSDPAVRYQPECVLCMFTGGVLLPRVDLPKKSQHQVASVITGSGKSTTAASTQGNNNTS